MEKEMDELFRKKLEEHAIAPSRNTWERIEAGLSKKNKRVIIWRMAAVITLMGGLLWAGISWQGNRSTQLTENIPFKNSNTNPSQKNAIEESVEVKIVKSEKLPPAPLNKKTQNTSPQQVFDLADQNEYEDPIVAPQPEKIEVESAAITLAETPAATQQKPIVLEFTLEQVESAPMITRSDEHKGIKGFFQVATELKNGESSLDLQSLRENLFAFNFKKDKSKVQEDKKINY